ncbi:hypothetical protein [Pontibacter ruber]|uniref:DUF1573 domain-containing protein n=1 Tax=Pontibacter ruber TaxID=1343895 RepID=A0ABW5CY75_9BACT|nr:hypothetical protein [Pontibacter ruber]
MKATKLILLSFLLFLGLTANAQEEARQNIYFRLDSAAVRYSKSVATHTSPYSKNKFTLNTITVKCNCHIAGYLSLSGHTNVDVGNTSEPAKVISDAAYKTLEFISFEDLVKLLKKYDLEFNDLYNLYLVEPCQKAKGKYTVYNVRFMNTFIDAQ